MPASAASIIASAAKGGGTKRSEASAPVASTASRTVLKRGRSRWVSPPLPGVTPPTTLVPWLDHVGGVEAADAAWTCLDDDAGVFLDERMAIVRSCQAARAGTGGDGFAAAASASVSAVMKGEAAFGDDAVAFLDIGARKADDDGVV